MPPLSPNPLTRSFTARKSEPETRNKTLEHKYIRGLSVSWKSVNKCGAGHNQRRLLGLLSVRRFPRRSAPLSFTYLKPLGKVTLSTIACKAAGNVRPKPSGEFKLRSVFSSSGPACPSPTSWNHSAMTQTALLLFTAGEECEEISQGIDVQLYVHSLVIYIYICIALDRFAAYILAPNFHFAQFYSKTCPPKV